MKNKPKRGDTKKYSTRNPSPRLLKTLKKVLSNQGGTVTYVFVEENIVFSKKFPKGKTIKTKSSLVSSINSAAFYKEIKGKLIKKTYQELLQLFEDISHDIGASYYIVG